jgi:hypothetical protein
MRKFWLMFIVASLGYALNPTVLAQNLNTIKGTVVSAEDEQPMAEVQVTVQDTEFSTMTGADGTFELMNVPNGEHVLKIQKVGFEPSYQAVSMDNALVDLGSIMLFIDVTQLIDTSVITITDEELSEDEAGGADNIAGLLLSSKDPYQRAVAFNWSSVFFRERGYDSGYGQILFNGIPMNKFNNGRPQWSDWGGINDVMRNTEFAAGINPAETTFGGVLGSTNYKTRASEYREGGRVSYAVTNSNYDGRAMASYNTGLMENGWAFSILGSRRYAQEGYNEGSSYNAWSGFVAIEKQLNPKHSLNLTAFYTPNRRGKNSPNTQEVYDLGGTTYNAYWGWQEGEKRNSRMKEIKEPTFFLSHYWDINEKTTLNTNVMHQFGTIGNSRLSYGTYDSSVNDPRPGNNPDPTYYKKLPSYYLNPGYEDYQTAFEYTEKFTNDMPESQIVWKDLYSANLYQVDDNAVYYQYEDVNDDKTWALNTVLNTDLSENITLNASALYKKTSSENYAKIMDLLGGIYTENRDKFEQGDSSQYNLLNPNQLIYEGDKYAYDYIVDAQQIEAFGQVQIKYDKTDIFIAGNIGNTSYQRDGIYQNGKFANTSYGKGEKADFLTFGAKTGVTYKLTGRHLVSLNGAYIQAAPAINNAYSNIRVYHGLVPDLSTTKIGTGDLSYIYRGPGVKARLSGYYTTMKDLSKVSYYFVQGVSLENSETDEDSEFLASALSGMNVKNFGGELGLEVQATPTVKFIGAASIGQYTYDNNPNLYVTVSEDYANAYQGKSYLKNYFQSGTPQRGYSIGAEYRDPDYWWVSANANLLTHNYISLSEFRRTDNFYQDAFDGSTITGLEQDEVDRILAQERLDDAFIVNLVGGKSWRINDYYLGFFASVNNLLGDTFQSGGFEQARKANYTELYEDQSLNKPLFGNKYWYGRGTTYYINFYVRF